MKLSALLIAFTLFAPIPPLHAQRYQQAISPTVLPDGTSVEHRLYLSHNKLRRGTTLEIQLVSDMRDVCMDVAENASADRHQPRIEFIPTEGLSVTGPKFLPPPPSGVAVGSTAVQDCIYGALSLRVKAQSALSPGRYQLRGKLSWQPITDRGPLGLQTTEIDFPLEVVEKKDTTAAFDDHYFGKDISAWQHVWGTPLLPFYFLGCVFTGYHADYCQD